MKEQVLEMTKEELIDFMLEYYEKYFTRRFPIGKEHLFLSRHNTDWLRGFSIAICEAKNL